jgi:muramoyltetrapeptide carboxypeptidase
LNNKPFNHPNPLKPGATIGIFSPAGALSVERVDASAATLKSLGYQVVYAPEVCNEWRYFAGTDDERIASFHNMLADPKIDAMMMSRGGYGFSRLLHRIDWQAVAKSKKVFCGFSDFTAFNLAALAKANFVTFTGPGAATDFDWRDDQANIADDHAFMSAHCWPALLGKPVIAGPFASPHNYPPQALSGPIWGSNLSLFTHLVGTPYMPNIEGGILFFEEIDEQPYAIERQFFQLFHAGILQKQKAIILADFTNCQTTSGRYAYTMENVIETLRELLPYPVLTGLPFGHVAKKLTIPFGGQADLQIATNEFTLTY